MRKALTSRAFIGMFVGFMLAGMVTSGFMAQLVPLLVDRGLTPAVAAGIASSLGLALIVGRLFTGYLLDRIYAPAVVVSLLCCPVLGLLIINLGSKSWIFAAPILIGLGMGAEMDFMSYLTSRYFPANLFGRVYGLLLHGDPHRHQRRLPHYGIWAATHRFLRPFTSDYARHVHLLGVAVRSPGTLSSLRGCRGARKRVIASPERE